MKKGFVEPGAERKKKKLRNDLHKTPGDPTKRDKRREGGKRWDASGRVRGERMGLQRRDHVLWRELFL